MGSEQNVAVKCISSLSCMLESGTVVHLGPQLPPFPLKSCLYHRPFRPFTPRPPDVLPLAISSSIVSYFEQLQAASISCQASYFEHFLLFRVVSSNPPPLKICVPPSPLSRGRGGVPRPPEPLEWKPLPRIWFKGCDTERNKIV